MAALEDTNVTYEQLQDLEREFDDVETEIIRQQVKLTAPLYVKREKVISQIPNFWPLVFEQAPPEIDEYIQPSDANIFMNALKNLSVSHFEIENGGNGDPRSLQIQFHFGENEFFHDSVLEKKFWYRKSKDGWAGLVSEPVNINWKEGKDLTSGLLAAVKQNWDEEQQNPPAKDAEPTATQKALAEKISNTGLGGGSFFNWFGFAGRKISAQESAEADAKEQERIKARSEGKQTDDMEAEDDDEDEDWEDDLALEICPDGDDLAVAIAEDLWPRAISYFTQAQEADDMSDEEFETEDEDEGMAAEAAGEAVPPPKKRKA